MKLPNNRLLLPVIPAMMLAFNPVFADERIMVPAEVFQPASAPTSKLNLQKRVAVPGWFLAVEVDVCTISVSCSDRIAVVTTGIDCCVKAEARNSQRQQPRVVCVCQRRPSAL